jgi:NAD(P)H-dependent FMN reductase
MKLAIIVGSTRPNRQTLKQAKWVAKTAQQIEGISPQIIDLVEYTMPFFNEPISPRYNPNREINPDVKKWLDAIKDFDAYIFITPEYNHSIPGVLKNAIDYITLELNHKPSAIVSHGSVGGARASMHLREILSESRSAVIPNTVAFQGLVDGIDDDGNLNEELETNPYGPGVALNGALTELKWYSDALAVARNE